MNPLTAALIIVLAVVVTVAVMLVVGAHDRLERARGGRRAAAGSGCVKRRA
jgi:hypothetical protein